MAHRVNVKEALRMALESYSGDDLDNDTYGNSDDFRNESDDESVADGIDFSINTNSMSNDDGSSRSHRVSASQTQDQAQHYPLRKHYTNTQLKSDSNNETNNDVSEVSTAPTPYPRYISRWGARISVTDMQ